MSPLPELTAQPERISIPEGYGLPADSNPLEWSQVNERLENAQHYWIGTIGPGNVPNPRPIDGVWQGNRLYFGGDPASRWVRNLELNPAASLNLESGFEAVILQGRVSNEAIDEPLAERLCTASNAKYEWQQEPTDFLERALMVFTPDLCLAWNTLYVDATRFRFEEGL